MWLVASSTGCFMSHIRRPTALFCLSTWLLNNRTQATLQGFSLMSSYSLALIHYRDIHNWAPDQKCGGNGKRNIYWRRCLWDSESYNFKLLAWEIFYATFWWAPSSELTILIHHCCARRNTYTSFSQHGVPLFSVLWLGDNLKRRKEKNPKFVHLNNNYGQFILKRVYDMI